MIKGIIFDLDGVLCSTDVYHYQAWKTIAKEIGIEFTAADNVKLRGVSRMESLEILLGDRAALFTNEEKALLAGKKNTLYRQLLSQMTENDVPTETRQMLKDLKTRYRLAVGSSSKNTGSILERTGIGPIFDAVADGNEIKHSKPDPEVFLLAADKLSLLPSECMVVEDAPAGIEAANAGGFMSVGLGKYVRNSPADVHIDHVTDLMTLLSQ